MPSIAYRDFLDNKKDVDNLILAHTTLNTGGRGKKGLGHITRSGVLMLCACFERYIESSLLESIGYFNTRMNLPIELPILVQKYIAGKIKSEKHELKIIQFASNNWKTLYLGYANSEIASLNTPKSDKIELLFKRLIGYDNFSTNWTTFTKAEIDSFISKRGNIAHNGRQAKYIKIGELKNDLAIIEKAVKEIDNLLLDYIRDNTNHLQPWNRIY